MSMIGQIVVVLISFMLSFVYIRCFIYGIKRYQLNNSAYKKRKKGETFKEWLLYIRYKNEIPKIIIVFYYVVLITHVCSLIISTVLYIMDPECNADEILVKSLWWFDLLWISVLGLLFVKPRGRGDEAYERWIPKRKGQNRKKKQ